MGETIELTAGDGHRLSGYRAEPDGAARGGIVVAQEIFGVNSHIRDVCDRFASQGYTALAPALFDRVERGVELGYSADDVAEGRRIRGEIGWDEALADIAAARAALDGKVGIVGFCWGGAIAWLSATRIDGFSASVAYYGGGIHGFREEKAKCPVMMHFGEKDAHIPMDQVEAIGAAQPEVELHVYAADHGFNCDHRASYEATSAALAMERTLDFLGRHLV